MLTLLVPNYNRPDELRNVVSSMVRAIRFADASDWVKICIVDDFSTEEISEVIESFLELDFFEFHVQREKCGNAETAALNALEYVKTEYVWLIGNDDEISEDSIAYLKPYLMKRLYYFILLNPVYKHFDGSLYMTLSATHEVLEYETTQDLFSDFGFVTSTTTLSCQIFHTSFTLNNAHTVDFAMKRCVFSRHGLQGFV
jgi:glycosyltransferase involved in cell wall biosynthesis